MVHIRGGSGGRRLRVVERVEEIGERSPRLPSEMRRLTQGAGDGVEAGGAIFRRRDLGFL
jgi:hypothetical protein